MSLGTVPSPDALRNQMIAFSPSRHLSALLAFGEQHRTHFSSEPGRRSARAFPRQRHASGNGNGMFFLQTIPASKRSLRNYPFPV